MTKIAALLYFLISSSGYSAAPPNCQNIDNVIPELGEVRNQSSDDRSWFNYWKVKNSDWCFAYTAADLVSHKLKKRVSAAAIAVRYYQEREAQGESFRNKPRKGGLVDLAVYSSFKHGGFCSEDSIKSDSFGLNGKDNNVAEIFDFLENSKKFQPQSCTYESSVVNAVFTTLNQAQIYEIVRKASGYESWFELTDKACENVPANFDMKNLVTMSIPNDDRGKMLASLNNVLDKGSIVGVGYDPLIAILPGVFWNEKKADLPSKIPGHGSTIVGRHWNEKSLKCEYKIRSTYGKVCSVINGNPNLIRV